MKKKRVLACALSAAMMVTLGLFSDKEAEAAYAATGVGESVTVTQKVLAEINSEVLKQNAKANSEQIPAAWTNDGGASWAFDDDNHWWHSRYQGSPGDGEVSSGTVSTSNPIWIQTGFGEAKNIKKITYLSRSNGMGSVNAYKVQYANVSGAPQDSDFQDVSGAAGNLQNVRAEQKIVFNEAVTATHIRLVVTSVYTNNGGAYVSAKRIRVFEETEETEEVNYNFYKESDFWDYEVAYGNLANQTEDADRWHYQIKKPSEGGWIDIPANALKANTNGENSWMSAGQGQDSTYHYAKLNKHELTSTFLGGTAYTGVAYGWKAPKNGYFKMILESPVTRASNPGPDFFVCHSNDNQDGKDLFRNTVGANGTISSKIAKVRTGEWIRFGATIKNAWASGLKPMIAEVNAKDYAVQYLEEVENIEEQATYTEVSKQAVREARIALQEIIQTDSVDMGEVEQKITELEQAVAGLEEYVPITGITLNQNEAVLTIGDTVQLTAAVEPDNANQEVEWSSDSTEIASVENGMVTAHKAGTAVITATSTINTEKMAMCTVVVIRDDTALDAAIGDAENKMQEEGYADKYTAASRKALEDALEIARAAKQDAQMGQGEVAEVVKNLQDALAGMERKAVVIISTNDQAETKYCEIGEQVKVIAANASDGEKFSHWTVNEKPICYNESYTFTVYKDITVTSVYIEEAEEVQKEVSVLCNVSYAKGKVKFLSKYSVPADVGHKVIKAGVVATDSTGYTAIQEAQQELTLDTTATIRLKKYGATTDLYLANFTQYLKTSRSTTWYARGYITYQNDSGEQYTVYSDIVQCLVQ